MPLIASFIRVIFSFLHLFPLVFFPFLFVFCGVFLSVSPLFFRLVHAIWHYAPLSSPYNCFVNKKEIFYLS